MTQNQTGLTQNEVQEAREKHGYNELAVQSGTPWYLIFGAQFKDLLVVILILAALVSLFTGHVNDALVILFIVLLNGAIGFFQEFKTEKTLEALKKMVHPEIQVIREGNPQMIETKFLVPGDLVILAEGDKIPADGQLIESHSLKIEESALTGESLPVEKKEGEEVFMGTSVVRGKGFLVVQKIGMETKFGEIAKLTTQTEKTKSPIQIELERIGVFVAKLTGVICVLLFFISLFRDQTFIESLIFSISVAIAAVPEGLNTTIIVALALGAATLSRKHAIVKKLSSVETLGAVTTICSDKTGTLTKNEMTVKEIYLADRSIFHVTGVGYDPHLGTVKFIGGRTQNEENFSLKEKLMQICAWCNDAKLVEKKGVYKILGDPTEGSLLTLVEKENYRQAGVEVDLEQNLKQIFPFDSDRKMMSVVLNQAVKMQNEGLDSGFQKEKIGDSDRNKNLRILAKGSPDQILEACTHWSDGEKKHKLDDQKREKIKNYYQRMAENALRVLAFAEKETSKMPEDESEAEKDLVFVGLVGMIDPPRESVKEAVKKCESAGVRVVVITGDYGITAKAIAKELGIFKENKVRVFTGKELKTMEDVDLEKILKDRGSSVIFARSYPEQKMRIVRLLQKNGEIVSMTGDGVNDAPALKKANIGVAMGITGTEVSKEAASMILMDDSFSSIVTAIEEGRRIYENLKKFVWFIFSCNIGELVVVFSAILLNMPLPLTAILILCIDLGTDILPAIALGVDSADTNIMNEKPRNTQKPLIDRMFMKRFILTGFVIGVCVVAAFLYTLEQSGWWFGNPTPGDQALLHAQTVAFTTLVFVQLFNAFSARSFYQSVLVKGIFGNQALVLAVLVSVLMVLSMLYIPLLGKTLGTVPLALNDWVLILLMSFIPLFFVEFQKKFLLEKTGKSSLRVSEKK